MSEMQNHLAVGAAKHPFAVPFPGASALQKVNFSQIMCPAFSPDMRHMLIYNALIPHTRGMVKACARNLIRQVLLINVMIRIVMSIHISESVSKLGGTAVMRVLKVGRHVKSTVIFLHNPSPRKSHAPYSCS